MSTEQIIRLGRAYARFNGLALSTVGRLVAGHGAFFNRVADGRVTFRRVDRAVQWFSDHWPCGLEWPKDLARPEPTPGSPGAALPGVAAAKDTVRAVRAAQERARAHAADGDAEGVRRAEATAVRVASRLGSDQRIASAEALCLALHVSRDVYYDVVRRFAGHRGMGRTTRPRSASGRVLRTLVDAGDARFALRRDGQQPGPEPGGAEDPEINGTAGVPEA